MPASTFAFQYPLRVLGCEKLRRIDPATIHQFQYPLRVLGCEKVSYRVVAIVSRGVSVPSAGSWL